MDWTQKTVIVSDAFVSLARALSEGLAGPAGAGMWTTGLNSEGSGVPTHWVSSGLMYSEFALMLQDPQLIFLACQGSVPFETIEAMLASSVISEGDPHQIISEAGLKIIQEET